MSLDLWLWFASMAKLIVLRLYVSSQVKPFAFLDANYKVEYASELLGDIGNTFGITYEIKDTDKMSPGELKALYKLAAHWASTSFDHVGVYEIFDGGTFFGKEVPALFLCFKDSLEPQGVFPHKRRIGVKEKVIAIYPFLYALKDRLSTPSIKEVSTTETAAREGFLEELDKLMELPEVIGYSDKLTIIEGEKCLTIYCVESAKYTPSSLPTHIKQYRIRCVKI